MAVSNQIVKIKTDIDSIVGRRVRLMGSEGRKRTFVTEGVLEETYPNLFVVLTDDEASRRLSFTYTDILTKTVRLSVLNESDRKVLEA